MKAIEQQKAIEQKWYSVLTDMPTQENVQQAYEELHSFYLSSSGYLYSPFLSMAQKVILRVAACGKVVLELGFGGGVLACALAKQGNEVVALDISPKAVDAGLKKAAEWGIAGHVTFRQGDAVNTRLDGDCFDLVVSNNVIEHIHPSKVEAHLNEVRRVLKANGSYLLFTPNKYDGPSSLGMHLKEWGFTEMRRFLEKHGFTCYWLDTRIARLGKTVLGPPYTLWLPDFMERTYVRFGCKRYLRPIMRPNPFFYARKLSA
ncbi:hypothetical protein LCGC14_1385760 [marine sediment metagenome]|uniref:Methyltransferase domain-containing protein n=1 Tax=marine sediment metagenome TaxID=412755 RepID=A0A0F9N2Y4_9ZZZZ